MCNLQSYTYKFTNLHANKRFGKVAPHKAVLLLSVMDLIECGKIDSPRIPLSDELVTTFDRNWKRYVGTLDCFSPDICKPFYHMQHESFWCLRKHGEEFIAMAAENSPMLVGKQTQDLPKGRYTLSAMREAFSCAEIDDVLFHLLQNQETLTTLRVELISTYMQPLHSQLNAFLYIAALSPVLQLIAS